MDDTLGSMLRGLRHATGQTLEDVAEATGISVAMLSRAERNQRIPSLQTVLALARHYGVPAEELQGHAIAQRTQSRGADDLSNQWAARNLLARSMGAGAPMPSSAPPAMSAPASRYATRVSWQLGRGDELTALAPGLSGIHASPEGAPPEEDDVGGLILSMGAPAPASRPAPDSDLGLDALDDLARVAEVAIDALLRAVERARVIGDLEQIEETERVIARLRRALEG